MAPPFFMLCSELLFNCHIPDYSLTATQWDRLILSLYGSDKVERLLVGLIAVQLE